MPGLTLVYIVCLLIVLIAIILLIVAIIEPRTLNVTHDTLGDIDSSNNTNKLNVCFFSDLHTELCFISPERIIKEIEKENKVNPIDIVIFGGDIINNPLKIDKGIKYLNRVSDYLTKEGIKFAGVTGNHDITIADSDLDKCGFINLSNTPLQIENKFGIKFNIIGVKDSGRHPRIWQEIPPIPFESGTTILVAHNPDQLAHTDNKDGRINYCLSGHIHGGQIRTPFKLEFYLRRKDELPKLGIYYGIHKLNKCHLFISKGLGCILFPFRLGAKPELNFLKICCTKKQTAN